MKNANEPEAGAEVLDAQMLARFGLSKDPFAARHDPNFLLRSKPLRTALDEVRSALDAGNDIVLVRAPRGTGKSALMDALRRELQDGIRTALVHRAGASWGEIGQKVGKQLRLSGGRLSPGAMNAQGGPVYTFRVIVNRAHRLSVDSLKHLAAYLELDAGGNTSLHRLQLILLAEPEEGVRLYDWLGARSHAAIELGRLDAEQTRRYVARRVQIGQEVGRQLFSSDALERICQLTDGRPGSINTLCRAALLLAASRGSTTVDAETVGTASRRCAQSEPNEAMAPAPVAAESHAPEPAQPGVPSPSTESETDAAGPAPDAFDEIAKPAAAAPRVEILDQEEEAPMRNSNTLWATVVALLLGIIAGGGAFLYLQEPPPSPEPQIVEVPVEVPVEVEKIVEVPVEVPVEVVKVVKVPTPPPPKARPPKPRPAKVAPPPAKRAPVIAKKKTLGPIPPAAEVVERAFANARPGNHTRRVEILAHGDQGAELVRSVALSRLEQRGRTLTLGVVTSAGSEANAPGEHRFLSIEKQGQLEDERFGYLPKQGRVERLKGRDGRDPFEGTSFHYADFRVRKAAQYVFHGIERTRVNGRYFYVVSAKPRYPAEYQRSEFVIDALDEVLVEAHYFKGRGLRPYRVVQYPKESMERNGTALVPMRIVSRNFETSRIDEARIVKLALDTVPDRKQFSLTRLKQPGFALPSL